MILQVAEWFGFRAKQPIGDDGHRNGHLLRDADTSAAKAAQEAAGMLSTLKAGDKVITNGGIYGVINGIDGDTVILKIADTGSSPVKNPHRAFGNYAGGGIGRCEINPPAFR